MSLRPCGCSLDGSNFIKSTMLITRILRSGRYLSQQIDGGQGLQRGNVAAAAHDHVRFASLVVAGPLPDADARRAVLYGLVHVKPLHFRLFPGHDHVYVVAASQAMVGHAQRAYWRRAADRRELSPLSYSPRGR